MNKKYIIAGVAILVLLLAGFLIFKMQNKAPSGNSETEQVSGMKSLKDLISSGVAQKCTYSTKDDSISSEGVTYISGGKVRGDFTTVSDGKTTASHMITDGKTNYIWTEGEKTGLKMTITDTVSTPAPVTEENGSYSGSNLDQKFDYKCSTWIADQSMFTPPTSVTFTDFSNMFAPTSAPNTGVQNTTQCSVCDSLSGSEKSQCLSALNCN